MKIYQQVVRFGVGLLLMMSIFVTNCIFPTRALANESESVSPYAMISEVEDTYRSFTSEYVIFPKYAVRYTRLTFRHSYERTGDYVYAYRKGTYRRLHGNIAYHKYTYHTW